MIEGGRGIVYFKDNTLYADAFQGTSSGHNSAMHIQTYKIKIKGDTLFFLEKGIFSGNMCSVFIKDKKIPEEYKRYNADW